MIYNFKGVRISHKEIITVECVDFTYQVQRAEKKE